MMKLDRIVFFKECQGDVNEFYEVIALYSSIWVPEIT